MMVLLEFEWAVSVNLIVAVVLVLVLSYFRPQFLYQWKFSRLLDQD